MWKTLCFATTVGACVLSFAQPLSVSAASVDVFWKNIPASSGVPAVSREALLSQFQAYNLAPRLCVNLANSNEYNNGIYYLGDDGRRHPFADARVFVSWSANQIQVRSLPEDQLASIPLGGTVIYKPGTRLIKFESIPKVYDMDDNGWLHWVKTPEIAAAQYGADWQSRLDVVSDAYYINYIFAPEVE